MKLEEAATRRTPRYSPVARAACSASSRTASAVSTRPRYSAPASVNDRARVLRVKSSAPSSRSRAATMREADGWESPRSRAARKKLPERATRTKTRKADMRSVIESTIHSRDTYILVHPGLYRPSRQGCTFACSPTFLQLRNPLRIGMRTYSRTVRQTYLSWYEEHKR